MASTVPKTPTAAPALLHSAHKEETSTRHYSDELVTGHIYAKHRDDDTTKIDLPSYISVIENILTTSHRITDNIHRGTEGRLVYSDDTLRSNVVIDPPLCTLHRINSELSCKAPGITKAHETTLEIFDILTNYPWEAKAALTLLAFTSDYGDLWHLYHYSMTDPLAKSLAIIKRVASLKKHLDSFPYQQVLLNPSSLIRSCLQAIKYMNQIREFSKYDVKELPELPSALRQIPLITYWVIHTIVASKIHLSSYLSETENQPQRYLNDLSDKIANVLNELEKHLNAIREQHAEVDLFRWLVDHIEHYHTDITLVVSKLLSGKTETNPLIDGSTLREVSVQESLSGKNVILVISELNISNDDIEALHHVYERLKTDHKTYEIVWIPIIPASYHAEDLKRYEYLRSIMKWHSIPFTTKIAGMRYMEERWQLREDPLVVVLNSQSKVVFRNAIHLIRVWGNEAIDFTHDRSKSLLRRNWPDSTLVKFTHQPRLQNWIKQEKSILFYGGRNPAWIQQFEERVEILKNDPFIIEGSSFEIVRIGKDVKGEDDPTLMSRFWNTQWGYFVVKSQLIGSSASETTEDILRLISYQNEDGWVVLTVGSAPVLVGRGVLILRLLEEFPKWKQSLRLKAFPDAFREYFNELALKSHQCDRVILPGFSGWIPMTINCPECPRFMETGISFKCCHGGAHM
ncbi:protein SIEVE ELEMENT OCCLUSION B-like [Cucurbita pepo subsp. pepo]|uniref:protein SIEVE ELEMENT OCCLUSION B-like n=1 Tax=Cucurbita pepo subsp. pepo TaxID=3664 RepID=UPI000C9D2EB3|nr:protein SIEVE ELEMENT OCCLUSION B-like [Cucurbita pepo subsp. pepo]